MDDKMTEQEVVDLMDSSTSDSEWEANLERVTKTFNGYPPFWYKAIVLSGLARTVSARWGATDELQIIPLR